MSFTVTNFLEVHAASQALMAQVATNDQGVLQVPVSVEGGLPQVSANDASRFLDHGLPALIQAVSRAAVVHTVHHVRPQRYEYGFAPVSPSILYDPVELITGTSVDGRRLVLGRHTRPENPADLREPLALEQRTITEGRLQLARLHSSGSQLEESLRMMRFESSPQVTVSTWHRRLKFMGKELDALLKQNDGLDFSDSPAVLSLLLSAVLSELPTDGNVLVEEASVYSVDAEGTQRDNTLFQIGRDGAGFSVRDVSQLQNSVRVEGSFFAEITFEVGGRRFVARLTKRDAAESGPGNTLILSFNYLGYSSMPPVIGREALAMRQLLQGD